MRDMIECLLFFMLMTWIFSNWDSCSPKEEKRYKILQEQSYIVTRQMGINDVYDTTYSYKVLVLKDSTIRIHKTKDRFSVGDVIMPD